LIIADVEQSAPVKLDVRVALRPFDPITGVSETRNRPLSRATAPQTI
jgi:hypothetical protein